MVWRVCGGCSDVREVECADVCSLYCLQMKSSIKLIKEHPRTAESLLNALR